MKLDIDARDAIRLASQMHAKIAKFVPATVGLQTNYASMLMLQIKANASGRPGPRTVSGDYVRSISMGAPRFDKSLTTIDVGTNKAQGRRLEFGFVGTDSLGRHYNQPPYPHFGPAVRTIRPRFAGAMALLAGDVA